MDTVMETFDIQPAGPFSLEESALFGFGQRHQTGFDGTMRLAFCVDRYQSQAGVAVTMAADGSVHGAISETPDGTTKARREAVMAQVARVLSIDHDATGYQGLGDRDPVIARLLAAAPGLRPPLFYSPYEAALWAVISMRRPRQTAERWRARLAAAAGAGFEVAGTQLWAVPTPERILGLGVGGVVAATGVEPARAERVVAVAAAAQAGQLEASILAQLDADEARARLRSVPGIGPFYADLILIRATGVTDVLPLDEPRLFASMRELYQLAEPVTAKNAERLAEGWRPWRTWVAVLFRAAGSRLVGSGRAAEPAVPTR